MKQSDKFFLIVSMIIFSVLGVTGVLAIALFQEDEGTGSREIEIKDLVVWGVLPERFVVPLLDQAEIPGVTLSKVTYKEMPIEEFKKKFVEALASGEGPDLVLIPHEHILEQAKANRLLTIPYNVFPRSTYEGFFVDAAKVFLQKDGILATPLLADPMVLYYNKTIENRELVRALPTRWSDLIPLTRIVQRGTLGVINQSLIPLGAVQNYKHTKELISLLIYQSVRHYPQAEVNLYGRRFDTIVSFPESARALKFYSEFADPSLKAYSWNESFQDARQVFTRGDLLLYPGFVSELEIIRQTNKNLRFGIAPMPYETGEYAQPSSFVRLYGLALPKTSRYPDYLLQAIAQASVYEPKWFESKTLPSALREPVLPKPEQDATKKAILDAVFSGIAWYDPAPQQTRSIFQTAVNNLVLNIDDPKDVTSFISGRLADIL